MIVLTLLISRAAFLSLFLQSVHCLSIGSQITEGVDAIDEGNIIKKNVVSGDSGHNRARSITPGNLRYVSSSYGFSSGIEDTPDSIRPSSEGGAAKGEFRNVFSSFYPSSKENTPPGIFRNALPSRFNPSDEENIYPEITNPSSLKEITQDGFRYVIPGSFNPSSNGKIKQGDPSIYNANIGPAANATFLGNSTLGDVPTGVVKRNVLPSSFPPPGVVTDGLPKMPTPPGYLLGHGVFFVSGYALGSREKTDMGYGSPVNKNNSLIPPFGLRLPVTLGYGPGGQITNIINIGKIIRPDDSETGDDSKEDEDDDKDLPQSSYGSAGASDAEMSGEDGDFAYGNGGMYGSSGTEYYDEDYDNKDYDYYDYQGDGKRPDSYASIDGTEGPGSFSSSGYKPPNSFIPSNTYEPPNSFSSKENLKVPGSFSSNGGYNPPNSFSSNEDLKLPGAFSNNDGYKAPNSFSSNEDVLPGTFSNINGYKPPNSFSSSNEDLKLPGTFSNNDGYKASNSFSSSEDVLPGTFSNIDGYKPPNSFSSNENLKLPGTFSNTDGYKQPNSFSSDEDTVPGTFFNNGDYRPPNFFSSNEDLKLPGTFSNSDGYKPPSEDLKLPNSFSNNGRGPNSFSSEGGDFGPSDSYETPGLINLDDSYSPPNPISFDDTYRAPDSFGFNNGYKPPNSFLSDEYGAPDSFERSNEYKPPNSFDNSDESGSSNEYIAPNSFAISDGYLPPPNSFTNSDESAGSNEYVPPNSFSISDGYLPPPNSFTNSDESADSNEYVPPNSFSISDGYLPPPNSFTNSDESADSNEYVPPNSFSISDGYLPPPNSFTNSDESADSNEDLPPNSFSINDGYLPPPNSFTTSDGYLPPPNSFAGNDRKYNSFSNPSGESRKEINSFNSKEDVKLFGSFVESLDDEVFDFNVNKDGIKQFGTFVNIKGSGETESFERNEEAMKFGTFVNVEGGKPSKSLSGNGGFDVFGMGANHGGISSPALFVSKPPMINGNLKLPSTFSSNDGYGSSDSSESNESDSGPDSYSSYEGRGQTDSDFAPDTYKPPNSFSSKKVTKMFSVGTGDSFRPPAPVTGVDDKPSGFAFANIKAKQHHESFTGNSQETNPFPSRPNVLIQNFENPEGNIDESSYISIERSNNFNENKNQPTPSGNLRAPVLPQRSSNVPPGSFPSNDRFKKLRSFANNAESTGPNSFHSNIGRKDPEGPETPFGFGGIQQQHISAGSGKNKPFDIAQAFKPPTIDFNRNSGNARLQLPMTDVKHGDRNGNLNSFKNGNNQSPINNFAGNGFNPTFANDNIKRGKDIFNGDSNPFSPHFKIDDTPTRKDESSYTSLERNQNIRFSANKHALWASGTEEHSSLVSHSANNKRNIFDYDSGAEQADSFTDFDGDLNKSTYTSFERSLNDDSFGDDSSSDSRNSFASSEEYSQTFLQTNIDFEAQRNTGHRKLNSDNQANSFASLGSKFQSDSFVHDQEYEDPDVSSYINYGANEQFGSLVRNHRSGNIGQRFPNNIEEDYQSANKKGQETLDASNALRQSTSHRNGQVLSDTFKIPMENNNPGFFSTDIEYEQPRSLVNIEQYSQPQMFVKKDGTMESYVFAMNEGVRQLNAFANMEEYRHLNSFASSSDSEKNLDSNNGNIQQPFASREFIRPEFSPASEDFSKRDSFVTSQTIKHDNSLSHNEELSQLNSFISQSNEQVLSEDKASHITDDFTKAEEPSTGKIDVSHNTAFALDEGNVNIGSFNDDIRYEKFTNGDASSSFQINPFAVDAEQKPKEFIPINDINAYSKMFSINRGFLPPPSISVVKNINGNIESPQDFNDGSQIENIKTKRASNEAGKAFKSSDGKNGFINKGVLSYYTVDTLSEAIEDIPFRIFSVRENSSDITGQVIPVPLSANFQNISDIVEISPFEKDNSNPRADQNSQTVDIQSEGADTIATETIVKILQDFTTITPNPRADQNSQTVDIQSDGTDTIPTETNVKILQDFTTVTPIIPLQIKRSSTKTLQEFITPIPFRDNSENEAGIENPLLSSPVNDESVQPTSREIEYESANKQDTNSVVGSNKEHSSLQNNLPDNGVNAAPTGIDYDTELEPLETRNENLYIPIYNGQIGNYNVQVQLDNSNGNLGNTVSVHPFQNKHLNDFNVYAQFGGPDLNNGRLRPLTIRNRNQQTDISSGKASDLHSNSQIRSSDQFGDEANPRPFIPSGVSDNESNLSLFDSTITNKDQKPLVGKLFSNGSSAISVINTDTSDTDIQFKENVNIVNTANIQQSSVEDDKKLFENSNILRDIHSNIENRVVATEGREGNIDLSQEGKVSGAIYQPVNEHLQNDAVQRDVNENFSIPTYILGNTKNTKTSSQILTYTLDPEFDIGNLQGDELSENVKSFDGDKAESLSVLNPISHQSGGSGQISPAFKEDAFSTHVQKNIESSEDDQLFIVSGTEDTTDTNFQSAPVQSMQTPGNIRFPVSDENVSSENLHQINFSEISEVSVISPFTTIPDQHDQKLSDGNFAGGIKKNFGQEQSNTNFGKEFSPSNVKTHGLNSFVTILPAVNTHESIISESNTASSGGDSSSFTSPNFVVDILSKSEESVRENSNSEFTVTGEKNDANNKFSNILGIQQAVPIRLDQNNANINGFHESSNSGKSFPDPSELTGALPENNEDIQDLFSSPMDANKQSKADSLDINIVINTELSGKDVESRERQLDSDFQSSQLIPEIQYDGQGQPIVDNCGGDWVPVFRSGP